MLDKFIISIHSAGNPLTTLVFLGEKQTAGNAFNEG